LGLLHDSGRAFRVGWQDQHVKRAVQQLDVVPQAAEAYVPCGGRGGADLRLYRAAADESEPQPVVSRGQHLGGLQEQVGPLLAGQAAHVSHEQVVLGRTQSRPGGADGCGVR
jgi:hypothetical protein